MEINTKIIEIKQALGKDSNKLYWQIETTDGKMTCHEKTVVDELLEFVGGMCNLAVRQTPKKDGDGFWNNIIGIVQNEEGITYKKPEKKDNPKENSLNVEFKPKIIELQNGKEVSKFTTMYVSYAKDIFIQMLTNISDTDPEKQTDEVVNRAMKKAIELVKQARDSFS